MTSSIDFKEGISFACGTPKRNEEKPQQTTLTAAIQGLNSSATKQDTKIMPNTGMSSR